MIWEFPWVSSSVKLGDKLNIREDCFGITNPQTKWSSLGCPLVLAHLVQTDVGLDGGVDAEGGAAVLVVDDAQSVTRNCELYHQSISRFIEENEMGVQGGPTGLIYQS